MPAKLIRERFDQKTGMRMQAIKWWDWTHSQLRAALEDFRTLSAEQFINKYSA